jgi:7-cyano-7-deazaguanine synthase
MTESSTAVLLSGGLDSAVLLVEEAEVGEVQPLYVSVGLSWERAERDAVDRFLAGARLRDLRPLVTLSVDMSDVYPPNHWALAGQPPAYHTPDEDVYLPGRNVILLAKAAVFCAAAGIGRLAIGTLDHNPFPDATPVFREAMAGALSLGLAHPLEIAAPYGRLTKAEVIRRGARARVPLELTLSCMNPVEAPGRLPFSPDDPENENVVQPLFKHCGRCSKCRERHHAFVDAGMPDPTHYVDSTHVSAP